jgi:carboxylesterase
LMLHGLGANSIELTRLAKDFHAQNFSVVAPNIEGYCYGSPLTTWQTWVQQLQRHYWQLKNTYQSVSVVGLSMGATLALAIAQREDPVAAVFLSTALAYDGWAMPWYQFLSKYASWIPFSNRYSFQEVEPYGVKNEEMRAMIKRAMHKDHLSESGVDVLPVKYLQEGQRLIKEVKNNMRAVTCPSLFIHAVDDETVHISNAEWAYKSISSAHKDILYLGDSYHMITVDNERETVSQEAIRFLKQAVNDAMGSAEFDIPPVQSAELRRYLRKRTWGRAL